MEYRFVHVEALGIVCLLSKQPEISLGSSVNNTSLFMR